jgi:hypothetical protein
MKLLEVDNNPTTLKAKIQENPYILTKAKGLGFKRVDEIALALNPSSKTSKFRLESYINYKLNDIAKSNGDTMIPLDELLKYIHDDVPECEEHLDTVHVHAYTNR